MGESNRTTRIDNYLIERFAAHGFDHVFGAPGDFVLALMSKMSAAASPLTLVNTRNDQGRGGQFWFG